jgi:ATP-dependent DNA helicase RecG
MIARVLSDFGWVRELNEGVKRIYTDMASFFLDPPAFSEPNGNTVLLVLRNNIATRSMRRMESKKELLTQYWGELNNLDRELVYYIANIDQCTPRVLWELTKRSRPTITTHLKKLLAMGIIMEHSTAPRDPKKYYTIC